MKLRIVFASFACALSVISGFAQPIEGRYIVTLKAGADPAAVANAHGIKPDQVYSRVINGLAGAIPPGILARLERDPDVERITPDNLVYAIGKPGDSFSIESTGQVTPAGVQRIAPTGGFTGAGIGVAVVDTGLDFNHADLSANISSSSFNGFAAARGQDDQGHGTHVGGIIAALNNTIDVVGVAPAAKLYAVKVLDSTGSGPDSTVIAGLDWVAKNAALVTPNIRVVNMSLGRAASSDDSAMHAAIQKLNGLNIAVVVAAGNDPSLEAKDQVPAGFSEVIAVASTTAKNGTTQSKRVKTVISSDTASYFTSDGALSAEGVGVTISAPGEEQENIDSAGFIRSVGILSLQLGGGTTRMSGTSMASPHVAGVAALLCQKTPGITPSGIRSAITASALLPNVAPYASPTRSYSFDGVKEGIVKAP
jgi:subtilisin